jgi:hypothetical protein
MGGNRNRRGLAATAAGQGQLGPTSSRDSMKGKTMVYDRYLSPKQRKFLFPSLQTAFLDSLDICFVVCVFEGVNGVPRSPSGGQFSTIYVLAGSVDLCGPL